MTSKKILEQLYIASQIGIVSKENKKVLKDYYKVVLRDLNKLENLEEENKVLLVNKNVAQGIAKKFKEENDKLKQALKILEERLGVELRGCINGGYSISIPVNDKLITPYNKYIIYMFKEQYELLKEVLGNDK